MWYTDISLIDMTKKEKRLKKIKTNYQNLTFNEFKALLEQCEWELYRIKGSHHIYKNCDYNKILNIQPNGNMAIDYQVKQFLKIMGYD